ncbi:hypothetical protein [Halalkalibacter hemicellulosilyticus]|uniref:Uncharacterized protein n=1 Tax=Halalkalibacter hemicellulosilyticusJCM 9152 TaxID=1236971 RepID=W4QB91_9BACI|nr:hypothetical protein [Halalkalibacter hemicellulosilyticus]GAE28918.1 hypothetical protein JCM9152_256 [Halalkalibacter hemicellulosilyticusJCM 9152]
MNVANDILEEEAAKKDEEAVQDDGEKDDIELTNINIDYIETNVQIAYQDGQEEVVNELIANQHEYLNELAGWGNAEVLSFEELIESEQWLKLKNDIQWLYEEGFDHSLVVNDMMNAEQFVRVAEAGDRMSIRYIHRIFHDLDASINRRQVDRVWGVTHAFGTTRQQQEVVNYLSSTQ